VVSRAIVVSSSVAKHVVMEVVATRAMMRRRRDMFFVG